MIDLNDTKKIIELDSMGSLLATENYDMQFREADRLGKSFKLKDPVNIIDKIIVLGTGGGSAITGGLIKSMFYDELRVPVTIVQGYNIPAFLDKNTLVIILSHSGNTEEVLCAVRQCLNIGAYMFAVTAGGTLQSLCEKNNIPYQLIPYDIGHPRRDIGYIFIPTVYALMKLGLLKDISAHIDETIKLFTKLKKEYSPEVPVENNIAKQIAIETQEHIPLIYGSLDSLDTVAWRWKNQFGENSKLIAMYNVIPNLHHDEAVGWDMPKNLIEKFYLIMLRDEILDSPKIKKRKDITCEILRERLGGVREVYSEGVSKMARLFSLIYLGDFVTLYTPIVRGVDPTPVEIINFFKRKMAQ